MRKSTPPSANSSKRRGAKFVLDTSGSSLAEALETGVFLIKPNLRELQELVGASLEDEAACQRFTEAGRTEIVALTLGDQGALLLTRDQAWRAPALPVKPLSKSVPETVFSARRYGLSP